MSLRKVMIVEDEVVVSSDLREMLMKLGYAVCPVVRYGEKVLEAVLQNHPDLILMDIKLKGEMDGVEAAKMLRNRLGTPVIFLTAYSDEFTLKGAKEAQPLGYIRKPVLPEDLRVNIEMSLFKVRMEEKLRQSEKRLDLAIKGTNAGLWDWHIPTGKTVFNERWAEIVGYTLEELEPTTINSTAGFCHPEDLSASNTQLKHHFAGKTDFFKSECRLKHKDGSWVWVLTSGRVMEWDNDGKPVRMTGTHIDITDSKRYAALAEAESQMAAAWNSTETFKGKLARCLETAVHISSMDSGGIYLLSEVNAGIELAVHQGLPETFVDNVSHFSLDSANFQAIQKGEPTYMVQADMIQNCFNEPAAIGLKAVAIIPIPFQGRVVGCLNIASHTLTEVPEHTRMALERIAEYAGPFIAQEVKEEILRKYRHDLETFFNTIKDMVFIFDYDGNIVGHNKEVGDKLGFDSDGLIGKHVLDIHPEDRHQEAQAVITAMIAGKTDTCMVPVITRTGRLIPVESKVIRGRWKDEEVFFCISRDISERLEIEHRKQQIEKAESLSCMAGAVAHHFNNMLSVVLGNLGLARMDQSKNSDTEEYLADAEQAARRAAELSGLMLTFLGQSQGRPVLLDFGETCKEYLVRMKPAVPENVALEIDFPEGTCVIKADPSQVKNVIKSLLNNAFEAIADSPGKVMMSLSETAVSKIQDRHLLPIEWQPAAEKYACVTITDNGSGMSADTIGRCFDPFYTEKQTGRGLGLAVALGIIKSYDGCIAVNSVPGRGSTFRFFLPLSEEAIRPSGKNKPVNNRTGVASETILLVEDEKMVRKLTKIMLERSGFSVIEARDGQEALHIFIEKQDKILMVLSDLSMPRMNGWKLLEALRRINPEIPVILTSGYEESGIMAGKHPEMPQEFLHKPYDMETLQKALDKVLEKSE